MGLEFFNSNTDGLRNLHVMLAKLGMGQRGPLGELVKYILGEATPSYQYSICVQKHSGWKPDKDF